MRLLVDTHVLLWALSAPDRLDERARDVVEDRGNVVMFSAVSIWEVAIKAGLGRVDFPFEPRRILDAARGIGFSELILRADVAAGVAALPRHHRDPFDRMLVAQAMAEPIPLYTGDARLAPYTDLVRLVGRRRA